MTKAICGTLLAIAVCAGIWVRVETMGPCDKFLGTVDKQCEVNAAIERYRAYYGISREADELLGEPLPYEPTDPNDLIGNPDDPLAD